MKRQAPKGLQAEPDSTLKTAALILWSFAYFHGLSMDLCGKKCAETVLAQIDNLYPEKKEVIP